MDAAIVTELIEAFTQAYSTGGMLAVAGIGLMMLVKLYRWPVIQARVPVGARWKSWPMGIRLFVIFALAVGGALVVSLATTSGLAWPALIAGAIASGITAITGHEGTKIVGKVLPTGMNPKLRQAMSIVIPIPKSMQAPVLKPK